MNRMDKFVVALSDLKVVEDVEKFDPNQPRHPKGHPMGGQWQGSGGAAGGDLDVMFEVAPNPDNQELKDRWNSLSDEERALITDEINREFTPEVLKELGIDGDLQTTIGGFEGEVNPSLMLSVSERPFEVAGALGDIYAQKAMVVMSAEAGEGLDPIGMIDIAIPSADISTLRSIQDDLGDLAGGWTYADGRMQILNFTDRSDADLAAEVDKRLGKVYDVGHATVYSAYIEEADYARPQKDSRGNAWSEARGRLSQSVSEALEDKLTGFGKRFNPNQERWPAGHPLGGQWKDEKGEAADGGDGSPKSTETMTDEKMQELMDGQRGHTIEELHKLAIQNQLEMNKAGERIAAGIDGAEFKRPPGENGGVKKFDGAVEKLARKGYDGPHRLTDLARASFIIDTPSAAHKVAAALAKEYPNSVFDEGWKTEPNSQYRDRKMLVQFANKNVGEIQVLSRPMFEAKFNGGGHELYELTRNPKTPRGQAKLFLEVMKAKYTTAQQQFAQAGQNQQPQG